MHSKLWEWKPTQACLCSFFGILAWPRKHVKGAVKHFLVLRPSWSTAGKLLSFFKIRCRSLAPGCDVGCVSPASSFMLSSPFNLVEVVATRLNARFCYPAMSSNWDKYLLVSIFSFLLQRERHIDIIFSLCILCMLMNVFSMLCSFCGAFQCDSNQNYV